MSDLLWKKHKPTNLDDIILLPRIREQVQNGVVGNYIFYGHFGTGKSTLATILINGKAAMYSNTSNESSIDILRTKIKNHIDTMSDIFGSDDDDGFKYVFLDEFEQASSAYQDALKGFMDENSDRVRFIFVTNHIHKVENGIKSRSTKIDFDPRDEREVKWWKVSCLKRLQKISEIENIDIEEIDLKKIVSYNFPDLRQMMIVLNNIMVTGVVEHTDSTFDNDLKVKLYKVIKEGTIIDLQSFVMEHYGAEKVQSLFNLCGRPLLETMMADNTHLLNTPKFGEIYHTVSEHSSWLNQIKGGDPVVVATSCLSKIQTILK